MTKEYIQPDLGCSGYLLASGFQLLGLKEISPNRYGFVFCDPLGRAEKESLAYFAGAIIGAEKLTISLRRLKAELRTKRMEKMERKHAYPKAAYR